MRFKKQVIIICLFTFLFVPFNKPKITHAEPITLTAGTVMLVSALVLGCGYVITNREMMADITYRMLDYIAEDIIIDGGKYVLDITTDVLNTVRSTIEQLPTYEVYRTLPMEQKGDLVGGLYSYTTPIFYRGYTSEKPYILWQGTVTEANKGISFRNLTDGVSNSLYGYELKVGDVVSLGSYFNTGSQSLVSIYINGLNQGKNIAIDNTPWMETIKFYVETGMKLGSVAIGAGSYVIPYTSALKEGVTIEKERENLGVGNGVISVPLNPPFEWDSVTEDTPLISIPKVDGMDISIDKDLTKPENPDVPIPPTTGDSIFDKILEWLSSLLGALLKPLVDLLQGILDFLKSLVIPEKFIDIDFKPLYFSFADKFPFSIPFDLINIFKQFNAVKKEPIFYVDMSGFSSNRYSRGEVGFEIDLTKFEDLFEIIRFFTLVGFVVTIALKTRDIIKG